MRSRHSTQTCGMCCLVSIVETVSRSFWKNAPFGRGVAGSLTSGSMLFIISSMISCGNRGWFSGTTLHSPTWTHDTVRCTVRYMTILIHVRANPPPTPPMTLWDGTSCTVSPSTTQNATPPSHKSTVIPCSSAYWDAYYPRVMPRYISPTSKTTRYSYTSDVVMI